MALHIIEDPSNGGGASSIIADRALYTNREGTELLEEGHEDAATLVVSHAGKPVPAEYVASLGLESVDGKVKQRSAGKDKELDSGQDKVHEAVPPKEDGVEADPIVSAGAGVFADMDSKALKGIAKERGVPSYTKMSDAELRVALAEGGAFQAGGTHVG